MCFFNRGSELILTTRKLRHGSEVMNDFAALVGRRYQLFDYAGARDADSSHCMMGSGCETAEETVRALRESGEKVGLVKVRLYRPFSAKHLLEALPTTVKKIAVLDRTKEPAARRAALSGCDHRYSRSHNERHVAPSRDPSRSWRTIRLASKEFTPSMVKGVFDELTKESPKNHFSIGIVDDVTFSSLPYDASFNTEPEDEVRAVFWGLGSDGTVSANKNSIKIIGEETSNYAQGYFVYDSKKAGAVTVSHLRFGPHPIQSTF